jgi:hypothetical protein
MSVAVAAVVFAGFAPTFYVRSQVLPPLPALTTVHGVAFSAWVVLLIVQVSLIATARRDLHRRLGAMGGGLAVVMIGLGVQVALAAARRDIAAGHAREALSFLIIPLGDILMFATLVGLALYFRTRPDFHKRFMLLATLAILGAAIGRIPFATAPAGFVAVFAALLAAAPVHELFTRGRPHGVSLWGGACVFASELGRFMMSESPAWLAVATWLVG